MLLSLILRWAKMIIYSFGYSCSSDRWKWFSLALFWLNIFFCSFISSIPNSTLGFRRSIRFSAWISKQRLSFVIASTICKQSRIVFKALSRSKRIFPCHTRINSLKRPEMRFPRYFLHCRQKDFSYSLIRSFLMIRFWRLCPVRLDSYLLSLSLARILFLFPYSFRIQKEPTDSRINRGVLPRDRETGTVETQSADYSGSAVFGFRCIACVFNFCNWVDGVNKEFRNLF